MPLSADLSVFLSSNRRAKLVMTNPASPPSSSEREWSVYPGRCQTLNPFHIGFRSDFSRTAFRFISDTVPRSERESTFIRIRMAGGFVHRIGPARVGAGFARQAARRFLIFSHLQSAGGRGNGALKFSLACDQPTVYGNPSVRCNISSQPRYRGCRSQSPLRSEI